MSPHLALVRHTIQPGETSESIARRYGVSHAELLAANPRSDKTMDAQGRADFAPDHFRPKAAVYVPLVPAAPEPELFSEPPACTWDDRHPVWEGTWRSYWANLIVLSVRWQRLYGDGEIRKASSEVTETAENLVLDFVAHFQTPDAMYVILDANPSRERGAIHGVWYGDPLDVQRVWTLGVRFIRWITRGSGPQSQKSRLQNLG